MPMQYLVIYKPSNVIIVAGFSKDSMRNDGWSGAVNQEAQ